MSEQGGTVTFFSDLRQLISDPPIFFDKLRTRHIWSSWLLVLIEIFASSILFVVYYRYVNLLWLQEQMLVDIPMEQRSKAARFLTVNLLTISTLVSVVVSIPSMTAIVALYFYLVGKVRNLPERFSQWFLLVAWASIVSILALPIGLVSMQLRSDGRLRLDEINPLSLNQLLLHLDMASHWRTFAEAIHILIIVEIVLLGIGYARWAGTSIWTGVLVAILPFATVYGIWAIVLMTPGT